jgi:hypothetical protein
MSKQAHIEKRGENGKDESDQQELKDLFIKCFL